MPRVELHICKLTANIDHNLNFCLKVKLVQRHEDGETRSLLMLQILHGFRSCKLDANGKKLRASLPSLGGYFHLILLKVKYH